MRSDGSPDVTAQTDAISDDTVQYFRRQRTPTSGIGLVLISEHGAQTHLLQPGLAVTVGRSAPAMIRIEDRTLSRVHARFRATDTDRVVVDDLGATNGVWRNGARVNRAELTVGAEIMLGSVLVQIRDFRSAATRAERADGRANTSASAPGGDAKGGATIVAGAAMQPVLATARRVASSHIAVVLHGETGSGKEVLAQYIHEHSPRAQAPMISLNCGAIPGELVESTLFGHERGAFSGAHKTEKGVFEAADGGTLFFDEIAELPLPAQVSLLRALETGRITRVGSTQERAVKVRIIAASHRDLQAMVQAGSFRADLFYRLETITLEIPPLRARKDEIAELTELFLSRAAHLHGRDVAALDEAARAALMAYDWPGNVRELRNAIERAVVVSSGPGITIDDLPRRVVGGGGISPAAAASAPMPSAPSQATGPESTAPANAGDDAGGGHSLRDRMQEYEAQLILQALHKSQWNRARAAKLLDMPVRTLAHKIKVLGLVRGPKDR